MTDVCPHLDYARRAARAREANEPAYLLARAHCALAKQAGLPVKVHALAGRLYLSESGWLLLSVPNAIVRGAFDALHVPGAELPTHNGKLNAHCTVMSPDDLEQIGGPDKVTERGHTFRYSLGALHEVDGPGDRAMSKVWYLEVSSPELRELRKSYGLAPTPHDGQYDFHVTVAQRRKNVLYDRPEHVKQSADVAAGLRSVGEKMREFQKEHTGFADYGQVLWHAGDKTAFFVGTDSDEQPVYDQAERLALAVPGVLKFRGEAEWWPKDEGWRAVYPADWAKDYNGRAKKAGWSELTPEKKALTDDQLREALTATGVTAGGAGLGALFGAIDAPAGYRWEGALRSATSGAPVGLSGYALTTGLRDLVAPQPGSNPWVGAAKATAGLTAADALIWGGKSLPRLFYGRPSWEVRPEHLEELRRGKRKPAPPAKQAAELPYRDRVEMYALSPAGKVLGGVYDDDRTHGVFGGGVEPGEDVLEAAAREFREESGRRVRNPRLLDVPPMTLDWKPPYDTPQQAERAKQFRGSRTLWAAGDLAPGRAAKALDPSWLEDIRLRPLPEALALQHDAATNPRTAARKAVLEYLLGERAPAAKQAASLSIRGSTPETAGQPPAILFGSGPNQTDITNPLLGLGAGLGGVGLRWGLGGQPDRKHPRPPKSLFREGSDFLAGLAPLAGVLAGRSAGSSAVGAGVGLAAGGLAGLPALWEDSPHSPRAAALQYLLSSLGAPAGAGALGGMFPLDRAGP